MFCSTLGSVVLGLAVAVQSSAAWISLLLARTGLAALAAGTAFILDEPAAAAIDVGPRGRPWRHGGRLPAVLVPLAVWGVGVLALGHGDGTVLVGGLWLEGVAVLTAVAAVAMVLRRSVAAPGQTVAGAAALSVVGMYVFASGRLHIYAGSGAGATTGGSSAAWLTVLAVSLVCIAAAAREPVQR